MEGGAADASIERWRHYLADCSLSLTIPSERPYDARRFPTAGAVYSSVPVPGTTRESVTELAARTGAPVRNVWLAAYASLLYRYTADMCFLVVESTAGDAVAHRVDLTGPVTFRELVGRIGAESDYVRERLDPIPADSLLEAAQPFAGAVDRTRFTAGFGTAGEVAVAGVGGLADLVLVVAPDGIKRDTLFHRTELCSTADAELIAEHLRTLTSAARAEPDRPIEALQILSPDEYRTLVVDWNATSAPFDPRRTFAVAVAEVAAADPGRLAVVDNACALTFGELDRAANRLANHLGTVGVRAGDRAAMLLERSAACVVAMLAIMRTGASAVLLDPETPAPRIAFMLRDSGATAVVTTTALAARMARNDGPTVVRVDDDAAAIASAEDGPPPVTLDPDGISHLVYTSGSTGESKAALERHVAMANLIAWVRTAYAITPADRVSWTSSPGFAVGIMEWIPFLSNGAVVHIADTGTVRDPRRLHDWLIENKITHALLVNTAAERVWSLDWPDACALRTMGVTGERLHRWPAADLPFEVVVVYGSTEATCVATTFDAAAGLHATSATAANADGGSPPIGRPIANVRLYVLDPAGHPVPRGAVGELYVAGSGVSAGYLDRPELTAERFVPSPIPEEPDPRIYRTGDLVRYRADSLLEIVGRADNQMKFRGYRIEPGEIEALLSDQQGIVECAVAIDMTDAVQRLVAYLVPEAGSELSVIRLRSAVSAELPHYAVPAQFVILDELPKLRSGKIDRKALTPSAGWRLPGLTAVPIGPG